MLHHKLKKKYSLCSYCLYRQLTGVGNTNNRLHKKGRLSSNSDSCYICQGIMDQLDWIVKKICDLVEEKKYQFDSFLLGATLPSLVFEREDSIRARFKLRGRENIKKQFVDELRKKFEYLTGKSLEHIIPDITINIVIDSQEENNNDASSSPTISVKSSPLFLAGRYVKTQRGLSQKKDKCQKCLGSGCALCRYLGTSSFNNIESIIASRILEITGGENPKFSWLGGEDKDSLVLGKGRPFLLRVSNPKIRSLKADLTIKENGVYAVIKQQKPHLSSKLPSHFITKTRITIQTEQDLCSKSLARLLNILENSEVTFKAKSKIVKKKIYSLRVEQIDERKFVLTIVADGGLLIKQFVGGQKYIEPNISKIIGMECECIAFDVLEVNTQ
ncbi:MAG: tRNA pseudouridine(54/55) synthase Pus10 [Nitrososphaeraceae archaeon]